MSNLVNQIKMNTEEAISDFNSKLEGAQVKIEEQLKDY